MPQDQYQTVKEVAERLKVAEATVRHWIKESQLRAIDIGKGWRIADADLADFLRCHQTAPKVPRAGLNGSDPEPSSPRSLRKAAKPVDRVDPMEAKG